MKRFVLVLAALGTFGLVMSGCNKDEKSGDKPVDEAAKPTEGDTKADETKPDEAKGDEAKGDEAKGDEAKADGDMITTGVEACDKLITRYMNCEKIPPQAKEMFKGIAGAWKTTVEKGGAVAKPLVATECEKAAKKQEEVLAANGC